MPTNAEQRNYLLMFVWGRSTGLFQSIDNFGVDQLHVASITIGYQPDIHLTFKADNPLHLTVRNKEGGKASNGEGWNGKLVGVWPTLTETGNALDSTRLTADQLTTVRNYRQRLNDMIGRLPADPDAAFLEKVEECASRGLITAADNTNLRTLYQSMSGR